MLDALNVAYGEEEKRSFIRLNAVSLVFTLGGLVFVIVALGAFAWKRRGIALLLALALLPAVQLVPVTRWWSPHYLYVPLAFAALLVAEEIERRAGERRTEVLVVAPALIGSRLKHALGDVDEAADQARERLERSLERIRAAG